LVLVAVRLSGSPGGAFVGMSTGVFLTFLAVSVAVTLYGVFLITAQEPREYLVEDPIVVRRIARAAILAGAVPFALRYYVFPGFHPALVGNLINIAFVVSLAWSLNQAQMVVERIPDERLSRLLRNWRRALLAVGLCFSGALMLPFAAGPAWGPWWPTLVSVIMGGLVCVYFVVALVSVGLFVGVALALRPVTNA